MVKNDAALPQKGRKIHAAPDDKIFNFFVVLIVSILFISVLYPMLYILAASFSSANAIYAGKVFIWPVDFGLEGYELVFRNPLVWTGYANTIKYTVIGTAINVSMIMIAAYPLSRRDLPGRNWLMALFTFTMYFGGGMIPNYLLVRDLHILDTTWALVLPGALSVYQMIVARTFLQTNIPVELLQAAQIDSCNDTKFFFLIVMPLSKAIIAVSALFMAVNHWNAYFNAMMYLNTRNKIPLQLVLREILISSEYAASSADLSAMDPELAEAIQRVADVMKYALIVVSFAPIMCFYPFAQKYFMKGVMIGAIKG